MILVFDLCLEGHGESVTAHKRDRCSLHRETWDESGKLCWQYTRSYNCNLLIEWNIPDPFANWYRKAYAHSGTLSIPDSHTNHKSSTEKMLRREDRWTQKIMDKEDKWRRMIACGANNNSIYASSQPKWYMCHMPTIYYISTTWFKLLLKISDLSLQ